MTIFLHKISKWWIAGIIAAVVLMGVAYGINGINKAEAQLLCPEGETLKCTNVCHTPPPPYSDCSGDNCTNGVCDPGYQRNECSEECSLTPYAKVDIGPGSQVKEGALTIENDFTAKGDIYLLKDKAIRVDNNVGFSVLNIGNYGLKGDGRGVILNMSGAMIGGLDIQSPWGRWYINKEAKRVVDIDPNTSGNQPGWEITDSHWSIFWNRNESIRYYQSSNGVSGNSTPSSANPAYITDADLETYYKGTIINSSGNVDITGNLTVGDITTGGILMGQGSVTAPDGTSYNLSAGDLAATGRANILGGLFVDGSLEGGLTFPGYAADFDNSIRVAGNIETVANGDIAAAGNVKGSALCIGTDCKSAWSEVGAVYTGETNITIDSANNTVSLDDSPTIAGILTVAGNAFLEGNVQMGNDANNQFTVKGQALFKNNLDVNGDITTNGNVGIGTTIPGEKLEVVGNILAQKTGEVQFNLQSTDNTATPNPTTSYTRLFYRDSDKNFGIHDGAETKLRIVGGPTGKITLNEAGGNVGIGTKSPSEKLEVVGNVKVGYLKGEEISGSYGISGNAPAQINQTTNFNAGAIKKNYPYGVYGLSRIKDGAGVLGEAEGNLGSYGIIAFANDKKSYPFFAYNSDGGGMVYLGNDSAGKGSTAEFKGKTMFTSFSNNFNTNIDGGVLTSQNIKLNGVLTSQNIKLNGVFNGGKNIIIESTTGDIFASGNILIGKNAAFGDYNIDPSFTVTAPSFFSNKVLIGAPSGVTDPGADGFNVANNLVVAGSNTYSADKKGNVAIGTDRVGTAKLGVFGGVHISNSYTQLDDPGSGALAVEGKSFFRDNVSISDFLPGAPNLEVEGNTSIGGNLTVTGTITGNGVVAKDATSGILLNLNTTLNQVPKNSECAASNDTNKIAFRVRNLNWLDIYVCVGKLATSPFYKWRVSSIQLQ